MKREPQVRGTGAERSIAKASQRAAVGAALAQLEQRFAQFRAEHARCTRIPAELRAAVLNAMGAGATATALRHRCGVSSSQLAAWQASGKRRAVSELLAPEKVRVFPVVDEVPAGGAACETAPEQMLELRLGPWSVSVRLAAQMPAGRG
jgi:hypothetical protein